MRDSHFSRSFPPNKSIHNSCLMHTCVLRLISIYPFVCLSRHPFRLDVALTEMKKKYEMPVKGWREVAAVHNAKNERARENHKDKMEEVTLVEYLFLSASVPLSLCPSPHLSFAVGRSSYDSACLCLCLCLCCVCVYVYVCDVSVSKQQPFHPSIHTLKYLHKRKHLPLFTDCKRIWNRRWAGKFSTQPNGRYQTPHAWDG
jgi:hypothetical protein